MKKIFQVLNAQRLFMLVFAMIAATLTIQAQDRENVIVMNDFEGGVNRTVNVPISMNNSDEVYAVQFDIELPFAMPQNGTPRPTQRLTRNGHSVSVHSATAATTTYRVVVYSSNNNVIAGNSGILLRLSMSAQDKGKQNYPVKVSNVVLTDKKGNNIATSQTAECIYTVSREDLPDLEAANVTISPATLSPKGKVTIGYEARNIGNGPTRAGWTEKYYLESVVTGQRCLLGNVAVTTTLAANSSIKRSLEFTVPSAPHIDGEVKAYVEMTPNHDTGELMVDDWNNSAYSEATVTLVKLLMLTCDKTTVNEGRYYRSVYNKWWTYDYITMTLKRTGDWSHSETFQVNCDVENLLRLGDYVLPQTVTIPAGSEGVSFRIYSVDDNIVRTNECDVTIPAAHGYSEQRVHLRRIDDDKDPLTLTTSASAIHEGEQIIITATRGGELTSDLSFELSCSAAHRFTKPRTITIPSGKASGQVTLTAIHDGTPQLDGSVRFSGSPSYYQSASVSIQLLDDDRPAISAVATPSVVAENAGQSASTLIITRDRSIDKAMKVKLACSRSDVVLNSSTAVFPAESKSIEVPVSILDNTTVDGERSAAITAQLYIDGSSAYAPSGDRAYATTNLRISDDEAPYLTLTSRVNSIAEGGSAVITVRRYVASTANSLTVALNSSDNGVTLPTSVTIPSGSYTATFTVHAAKNENEGDERMVTLTATAQDIEPAALTLRISDRTLPDAVCLSVDYDGDELYAGIPATLYAEVGNEGTAILSAGMRIDFYLATASSLRQGVKSTHITTVYTERELTVGEIEKFKFTAVIPEQVGTYWLYARVNSDNKIPEFSTSNNVSRNFKRVFVAAPFSVESIATDRESYLPGELVTVTGRVAGRLNGQTIRVTLKGSGQRTYGDTRMGADGLFRTQVAIDRSAAGIMKVMALAIGQTDSPLSCNINVWNMQFTADKTRWIENVDYQRSGKLTLKNTSGKVIDGIVLTHNTLPDGCLLEFNNIPQSIAAGETVTIGYTVTPKKSMTGTAVNFMITAKCRQGVSASLQINYFCRATTGNLSLSPQTISTTLLEETSRQVSVKLTNYGMRATGQIALSIPAASTWLRSLSGRTLKSLAPGESTVLYLQLTHNSRLVPNHSYASSVLLTPESGTPKLLNVTVKIVEKKDDGGDDGVIEPKVPSQIIVQTHDVYSKSDRGFSHVSGAAIKVTNIHGTQVAGGTADANGKWTATGLAAGVYNVEASADRHKTVRTQLVVGPSETLTVNLYLPYKAVLTNFIASTDMETGEYKLSGDLDIDYDAPQAIVVPQLPEYDVLGCNDTIYAMTITNVGSRPAINMGLTLPKVPGVNLKQLTNLPTILYPKESWVVDLSYSSPEERRQRSIAALLMKYGFSINGENFSEEDTYQVLMGCGDGTMKPEVIEPIKPEPQDSDSIDYKPFDFDNDSIEIEKEDPNIDIPLPTYDSYMKLTFIGDVSKIYVGQTVEAVLEVKNGQEGMFNHLNFYPEIMGYYTYEDSTDVFSVSEGAYTGFTKTADGYTLAGNTKGTLLLKFTPKDEAAVEGMRDYLASGYITYIDQQTKISNAASLSQTKIVVSPRGKIKVMFFMQHNFMADDPSTSSIESMEPTEMAVLVTNPGKVDVTTVKVSSTAPVVLSNTSGSEIGYEQLYSQQVNDGLRQSPADVMFTEISIDTIASGSSRLNRFFYGTDEMGHLSDNWSFTVGSTAVDKTVFTPKNLVRTVKDMSKISDVAMLDNADEDALLPTDLDYKINALAEADMFLVSEIMNASGTPDMIWPADGSQELSVTDVSGSIDINGTARTYTLNVNATAEGWVYGRLHDPTNGKMILSKVVRQSDGMIMSAANFWQTDRMVQQDYSIIYENNLHFADSLRHTTESYQLIFDEISGQQAKVMNIRLFTEDGTEVFPGTTTKQPVVKALVYFTRPMAAMKKNRYSIIVGGDTKTAFAYDTKLCMETYADDDKATFVIDMSKIEPKPGLHSMRVWCDRLRDLTGVQADPQSELEVLWTEDIAVKAHLEMLVGPDIDAGSIDRVTADYDYGRVKMTATPAEGYRFTEWQVEGTTVSRNATLEYDVTGAATLRAIFTPIDCDVVIDCDSDLGMITGFGSGSYSWGETLLLSAVPIQGYVLESWLCDGEKISNEAAIRVAVDGNHTYTPVFVEEVVDGVKDTDTTTTVVDSYWYSLQGIKLGKKRPTIPGIYIHCGKTISVK